MILLNNMYKSLMLLSKKKSHARHKNYVANISRKQETYV